MQTHEDLSAEMDKVLQRQAAQQSAGGGQYGSGSSYGAAPSYGGAANSSFQQPSFQPVMTGSIGNRATAAVLGSQVTGVMGQYGSARQIVSGTLDESVADTFKRDACRVRDNVKAVLLPGRFGGDPVQALRDWDLWGPLIFTMVMAIVISVESPEPQGAFAVVFATVGFGAVALTLNVQLLGGSIIFFQSVALLGYCVCPLTVAACLCLAWSNGIYQLILLGAGLAWSTRSAVPFIQGAVPAERRALAVYPVLLLYVTLAWIAFVSE